MSYEKIEIIRLKEMLEEAKIPFEFYLEKESYHICYPMEGEGRKCSVVQSSWTYGGNENKLEIMGLLTGVEREENSVLGWLCAEEVFERIVEHWRAHKDEC